jgi:aspartate aminotransferase
MTGWRIGYAGGPADLIAAMATIQSQSTTNPSSVSQAAAAAALTGPLDFLAERNEVFRVRRDLCLAAFNSIDGLSCRTPDGAFYLFPSCRSMIGRRRQDGRIIESDVDFATLRRRMSRLFPDRPSVSRLSSASRSPPRPNACVLLASGSRRLPAG